MTANDQIGTGEPAGNEYRQHDGDDENKIDRLTQQDEAIKQPTNVLLPSTLSPCYLPVATDDNDPDKVRRQLLCAENPTRSGSSEKSANR
ncbi:hypothetical protein Bca101_065729 [Brassica carinata]